MADRAAPSKGQLILKCPFGVFKSPKKNNDIFLSVSGLAPQKRSNQKSNVSKSKYSALYFLI